MINVCLTINRGVQKMNTETKIEKRGWCNVNFEITLEGESIRFKDLSESNQEYICRKLSDGYRTIEIIENNGIDYNEHN